MTDQAMAPTIQKILKLTAVAAVFVGSWLVLLLQTQLAIATADIQQFVGPAISLAVALPLATLAAVVFDRLWFAVSIGVLIVAQLVLAPVSIVATLSWLLLAVGFWWAYSRVQFELSNDVKFTASRLLGAGGSIMLLYLLAVSVQAYGVVERSIAADELGFYRQVASTAVSGALPLIERQLPGFKADMTVDQYVVSSFSPEVSAALQRAGPNEREEFLARSRRELLQKFGLYSMGDEPLSNIIKDAVTVKLRDSVAPYRSYLPIIYTIGVFLLLRAAAFFVDMAAQLWGLLLFWLLRTVGFLKIIKTQIEAEHLII